MELRLIYIPTPRCDTTSRSHSFKMTLLDEAVARYHKLIAGPVYQDGAWIEDLHGQMKARHLFSGGRPICPVLRPHLVTRRQYSSMVRAAEALYSAMDHVRQIALANPALLARMELLPAEKMLAAIDPGYPYLAVTSLLDTNLHNGSLRFTECHAEGPGDVAYADTLTEIFYDRKPVKELRKRYKLSKISGTKRLLHALLAAYKLTGKKKYPCIAIVEFRHPFQTGPSAEYILLAEHFRQNGFPAEVVTPDQITYRNGELRRGDFLIDIVYRRISAQEFLVRFDLAHPLLRAYRDRAICMVNGFRTEIVQKKAIFGLLTDSEILSKLPAAERDAVREHIPWTRLVKHTKTTYGNKAIDLAEFILTNRENLSLRPNDPSSELQSYNGWEMEAHAWERALKAALRTPYVVQERVEPATVVYPVYSQGSLDMRSMAVDLQPHIFLGKVESCSCHVTEATPGFSTLSGIAPTFVLESNS